MATAGLRSLPDFVLIGAQKSGTTSLYDFMTQHPCIEHAPSKELYYFTSFYRLGEPWYRSNFPTRRAKKRFLEKHGRPLLAGEATPYYLFHPLAPARMRGVLPSARIIAILRNPVDRAYSHYQFSVRRGHEALPFEEALEEEESRLDGAEGRITRDPGADDHSFKHHSYLSRGVYYRQLSRWFGFYPREQFLFLTSEELGARRQEALDRVFGFLGLDGHEIRDVRDRNVGRYGEMSPGTRDRLVEYFRPHNRRLSELLGRGFDWDR